jgi:hypothetical protein
MLLTDTLQDRHSAITVPELATMLTSAGGNCTRWLTGQDAPGSTAPSARVGTPACKVREKQDRNARALQAR